MYGKLNDEKNINSQGIGIGLSFSQTLAHLLGGEIKVSSIY